MVIPQKGKPRNFCADFSGVGVNPRNSLWIRAWWLSGYVYVQGSMRQSVTSCRCQPRRRSTFRRLDFWRTSLIVQVS